MKSTCAGAHGGVILRRAHVGHMFLLMNSVDRNSIRTNGKSYRRYTVPSSAPMLLTAPNRCEAGGAAIGQEKEEECRTHVHNRCGMITYVVSPGSVSRETLLAA